MDHGIDIEKRVRDDLLRLGKELGIPPVATNDSHYNNPEDADAHDALLCVASGSRDEPPYPRRNRFKFDGSGYYIKSAAEMRELWATGSGLTEACDNTLLIAERCEVEFTESTGGYMAASPTCPTGETEESWLRQGGLARHRAALPGERLTPEVRERVEIEIDVIPQKGYCGYFLVVADFIQLGQGQRHPGRAGPWLRRRLDRGLRAAHHRPLPARARPLLRAVPQPRATLDARLRHRLRRPSPRRGHPVRHREVRRGPGRPDRHLRPDQGQAGDQGRRPRPRLRLRDRRPDHQGAAARRDGQGRPAQGASSTPTTSATARAASSGRCTTATPTSARSTRPRSGSRARSADWGVHAAGVIMSSEPMIDIVADHGAPQDGAIITQFDYPMCEALGLVKMDFLGLSNLHILDDAARQHQGQPRQRGRPRGARRSTTAATYELMRPRRHPRRLPARRRRHAGAAALDAPRPVRRHHRGQRPLPAGPDGRRLPQQVRPPQERPRADRRRSTPSSRAARAGAGGDLRPDRLPGAGDGDRPGAGRLLPRAADNLRRAMGKKKKEELDKQYAGFQAGMLERGYSPGGDQDDLGHPGPVLRLRLQQVALGGLRRRHLLDRLPQGQLPDRVHGRAPHLGRRTTRTRWRSTSTSVAG